MPANGRQLSRSGYRVLLVVCVAVVSCVPGNTDEEGDSAAQVSDAEAIRALLRENQSATNQRDAAGVVATFMPEADIVFPDGRRVSGLDEIRRNEEEFYATPGFREWRVGAQSIRFPRSDVAVVEAADTTSFDSGDVISHATLIVVRGSAGWRIAAVRVLPTPSGSGS